MSESRKDKLAAGEPSVAPFPSPPPLLTFTRTESKRNGGHLGFGEADSSERQQPSYVPPVSEHSLQKWREHSLCQQLLLVSPEPGLVSRENAVECQCQF